MNITMRPIRSVWPLCLLLGAAGLWVVVSPELANARTPGASVSRHSPASGGGFSSRPTARVSGGAGSVSGFGQPRGAGSAGGFGQPGDRGTVSRVVGGAGTAGTIERPPRVTTLPSGSATRAAAEVVKRPASTATARPLSEQEMQQFRQQFAAQNKDNAHWDEQRPIVVEHPVAVAVVVGGVANAVVANNIVANTVDTLDVINTVSDPTYLSEVPCTIKAVMAVDNTTFYRCESAWYRRGYQGGEVVYIPTDAPPDLE